MSLIEVTTVVTLSQRWLARFYFGHICLCLFTCWWGCGKLVTDDVIKLSV